MWQKVAKFKGAEYCRKALYQAENCFSFRSSSICAEIKPASKTQGVQM